MITYRRGISGSSRGGPEATGSRVTWPAGSRDDRGKPPQQLVGIFSGQMVGMIFPSGPKERDIKLG